MSLMSVYVCVYSVTAREEIQVRHETPTSSHPKVKIEIENFFKTRDTNFGEFAIFMFLV